MKVVIFGQSVGEPSASPHAAMWRALIPALRGLGHRVVYFARAGGNSAELGRAEIIVYPDWERTQPAATKHLSDADAAIVTSESPDAPNASEAVLASPARVRCFYELDPAATLGRGVPRSIPPGGLGEFDLVLSYTGGGALAELKSRFGAKHVAPLYGCIDPSECEGAKPAERYRADLSYLGEWLPELDGALDALFLEPARRRPDLRFVAGCSRPPAVKTPDNVAFLEDLPVKDHPSFFVSSRITLNVTSNEASEMGYCPPERIFEAAACGVPVVTDDWGGLDYFFEPGREILVARTTGHVMDVLAMPAERLAGIGRAGRRRMLAAHTAARRALDLENILEAAISLPVEQSRAGRH